MVHQLEKLREAKGKPHARTAAAEPRRGVARRACAACVVKPSRAEPSCRERDLVLLFVNGRGLWKESYRCDINPIRYGIDGQFLYVADLMIVGFLYS